MRATVLLVCKHTFPFHFRLNLNIWDVGGQRSLRSYWRNYFECTDGVVWVVDSADRVRMEDCRTELHSLLVQEVCIPGLPEVECYSGILTRD